MSFRLLKETRWLGCFPEFCSGPPGQWQELFKTESLEGRACVDSSSCPEVCPLRCKVSAEPRAGLCQLSAGLGNPMWPRIWLGWRQVGWEEMPVSCFEKEKPRI